MEGKVRMQLKMPCYYAGNGYIVCINYKYIIRTQSKTGVRIILQIINSNYYYHYYHYYHYHYYYYYYYNSNYYYHYY